MKFNIFYFFTSLILANSNQYLEYWPNDSLKVRGQYLADKKHGKWEYFNLKGRVWKYIIFKNGKKVDEMKWQMFKPKQSEIDVLETFSPLHQNGTRRSILKLHLNGHLLGHHQHLFQ